MRLTTGATLPCWLFVSYGGGHVKALLPVAERVRALGLAEPIYLGLTTAGDEVRRAGLRTLGFSDFLDADDSRALAHGQRLAAELVVPLPNEAESVAYLGLSYADLEDRVGVKDAAAQYTQFGRQAFLPLGVLRRVIERMRPGLVVATNAPRAEQAAIQAARAAGVPAACLVDLLGLWEQETLAQADYADAVCVLNDSVRDRLLAAGRSAAQVHATGNPAFDGILDPEQRRLGAELRARQPDWSQLHVCLYASSPEPRHIDRVAGIGDPAHPRRIEDALVRAVHDNPALALWIRRHPSEAAAPTSLETHPRIRIMARSVPLHAALHACDEVVVSTSTVGVEGALAGRPVVQVRGSILDHLVAYRDMGIAWQELQVAEIAAAFRQPVAERRRAHASRSNADALAGWPPGNAAGRVVQVLQRLRTRTSGSADG